MTKLDEILRLHKNWIKLGPTAKDNDVYTTAQMLDYFEAKRDLPKACEKTDGAVFVRGKNVHGVWFEPF